MPLNATCELCLIIASEQQLRLIFGVHRHIESKHVLAKEPLMHDVVEERRLPASHLRVGKAYDGIIVVIEH